MRRMTRTKARILGALLDVAPSGELYGLELTKATSIPSGSMYPALRDLRTSALVEARWEDDAGDGPRRRFYRLTPDGVALASALRDDQVVGTSWRRFLPGAGELA